MHHIITKDQLPHFSDLNPATIQSTINDIVSKQKKQIDALLLNKQPTFKNLLSPMEDMHDELTHFWAPINHMHAVMETEALREAYNQVLPILTEFHTWLSQHEKLYQAVLHISTNEKSLNQAEEKIIEHDLRNFKLAGIHLSEEKKNRLATLNQKLSELTTKFSENLLDATHHFYLELNEDQIAGLPEQSVQLAKQEAEKRELAGYVLTLDFPSYSGAMKYLKDRKLREKMYEAYSTRASDLGAGNWDNTPIIHDILSVKKELATLVGFDNYATYSLATKMAKTPGEVLAFLNDLAKKSKPYAEKEMNALKKLAKEEGVADLSAWDMAYYSEKLQHALYSFNQEEVRPYFPTEHVLNGMFSFMKTLFGLTIKKQVGADVWREDVAFYNIHDEHGTLRGGFYIDLYARDHKRDGAWMDDARTRHLNATGRLQLPIAFLTCNFMPPVSDKPGLLTHDDVITLFHEFGHCLHHMLTLVDYPSVAGINGVAWDAVEFPSQFLEYFCWEKEVLKKLTKHWLTDETLPDELYEKMLAAKHFQTGLHMMRQLEFALFDFRLHAEFEASHSNFVQTILTEVRQETALITVPTYNRFQNSFSHIFGGGYAAGYYSYKWAEVLAADAYETFLEKNADKQKLGRAFMHELLEVGSVREPLASFVAFKGRTPTVDALLRQSGMQE